MNYYPLLNNKIEQVDKFAYPLALGLWKRSMFKRRLICANERLTLNFLTHIYFTVKVDKANLSHNKLHQ